MPRTPGNDIRSSKVPAYVHLLNPRRTWYNNRRLVTASNNGYDGTMMNGLQSLPQWKLSFNNPSGSMLGLLNAIQHIGSLGGYPFSPYLADGLGRRRTVFIGAVLMCMGTVVQTASQSVGMFIGARFLIGFGHSFAAAASPMLITEVSYPLYRGPLTSTYNALWQGGAIVAAWTTFGTFRIHNTWSWRIPSAFQGIPALVQVCLILFAPESPRWLIGKGRHEEALKTLAYYHADGDENDPLVQYEFNEIKNALEFDRTVAANVGWLSLIATPGNRRRLRIIVALAFFSQWSGNGLVSYYLNKVFDSIGITDPTIQLLINGILQIWNLTWALLGAALCDRAGRRPLFLVSTAGMAIFFTLQTVCSAQFAIHGSTAAAHAVIAFIFLFYASYDIAFSPLITSYAVEVLPFALRAKGFMVYNISLSLSLIFNQYVNPVALDAIQWKYYIVYCCWIVFEWVYLYLFVVETKNRTLEETAALFDGEEATQHIQGDTAALDNQRDDLSEEKEKD
ncbi:hypothetical protein EYR38_001526 [Pleurotus pulmonarius]|nr:hypothetical protein EYR38_001526 [Pleurotus pulmonarius]